MVKNYFEKGILKNVKNIFFLNYSLFVLFCIFFLKDIAILLVLPTEKISLWPELSSPPCFRILGESPERDGGAGRSRTEQEILVSNIGFCYLAVITILQLSRTEYYSKRQTSWLSRVTITWHLWLSLFMQIC